MADPRSIPTAESDERARRVPAQTATPWSRPERGRVALLIALGSMMLLHAALFPEALLVVDSGRDIANAWAIASGTALPAVGPEIYGTWALGPAWYYVLAVPFVFGGSLGALAWWVGLLAACKLPLAYLLGRHWYGPACGLALAALVALPGWNSVGAMVIVHTAVIEAAALGSLLASSVALARPDTRRLLVAALVFSLALHAHPTAVAAAPWLVAAFVRRLRQGAGVAPLALGIAVFVLPWLPMLVAEAMAGWPQLGATRQFASQTDLWTRSGQVLPAVWGVLVGWAALVAHYLVPALARVQMLLAAAWFGGLAVAAVGIGVSLWRRSRLAAVLLCNVVAALWLVSVLREGVPVYMLYAVFPLVAWLVVHGWQALATAASGSLRWLGVGAWVLVACALALQMGMLLERRDVVAQGTLALPGGAIGDVRAPVRDDDWARFWLPASDHESIAAVLCGASTAVHGELAGAIAWGRGVAVERACGDLAPVLGGRAARRHVAGLPVAHAWQLGIAGERIGRGFVQVEPVAVLHPEQGLPIEVDPRYAVDAYRALDARAGTRDVAVDAPCGAGNVLVVANAMPVLNPVEVEVIADGDGAGEALVPELRAIGASYFACDGRDVRVVVRTLEVRAVDVFVIGADG